MSGQPYTLLFLLLVTALAACGTDRTTETAPVTAAAETRTDPLQAKLDRIFTYDMLGADRAYLKQFTGIPWQTNGDQRTYKVEGCEVGATIPQNSVRALSLKTSDKCTFNLANFHRNWDFVANNMTFGAFDDFSFSSDCLSHCGNAYEPSTYAIREGSHAENFLEIKVSTDEQSREADRAIYEWSSRMETTYGADYILNRRFNCDGQLTEIAQEVLLNERIKVIEIGGDLSVPGCTEF